MKTIKLFIIAALATLMGGSLFSSCADDNDDFLSRNDKELSDLNKEDTAIRAELKKQIELTRTAQPENQHPRNDAQETHRRRGAEHLRPTGNEDVANQESHQREV